MSRAAGARVLIAGMRLPPNYGPYAAEFFESFTQLARQHKVALLPFLLEPVAVRSDLFLPDNQLLLHLIERTGDTALYLKLWRQPVDHDSLTALHSISRFHTGQEASDLLIAASRNGRLMIPALQQLSRLSPLPDGAQQYLLAELGKHQYGGLVAGLLLQMDEPRLLGQLADRLTRQERRHASSIMLPDTGTPDARPGL